MAKLIVFEGIDGSGKTTLSKMFVSHLESAGVPVVWLCEPTDSPSGDKIRELARTQLSIPAQEELDYFIEDRKIDVEKNIWPALKEGKTVVLDRYFYSNACYQGARGLDMAQILACNREFAPEANLIFLVDCDPETALGRIRQTHRQRALLFEKKAFLQKVRDNYLQLHRWVQNIVVLEGAADLHTVFARILDHWKCYSSNSRPQT